MARAACVAPPDIHYHGTVFWVSRLEMPQAPPRRSRSGSSGCKDGGGSGRFVTIETTRTSAGAEPTKPCWICQRFRLPPTGGQGRVI
jgi:hypothetical protein